MSLVEQTIRSVAPVLPHEISRIQTLLDRKTKPVGSLGHLEQLASRYAAARGTAEPEPPKACVVIMAADHGVADEGVSAFPQAVTRQMLQNFASGGAAINAIASSLGVELRVVDVGVIGETPPGILSRRVASGTQNFTRGPAMTRAEATCALEVGIRLAGDLSEQGYTLLGLGEMGIANTTIASALTAVFTGESLQKLVGHGTGIDSQGWQRKHDAIKKAIELNKPDPSRPLEALALVGGLEVAALAGLSIGAAARRIPVVLDGFIASSAALVAARLCPALGGYLFASHCSVEPGHRVILTALDLKELFDLNLRLGEGTGAALAMPWFTAAASVLRNMATFESAGVSGRDG